MCIVGNSPSKIHWQIPRKLPSVNQLNHEGNFIQIQFVKVMDTPVQMHGNDSGSDTVKKYTVQDDIHRKAERLYMWHGI